MGECEGVVVTKIYKYYSTPYPMDDKIVLKKICPYCSKEITSLYPNQLEYNYQSHLISCKYNHGNIQRKDNESSNESS